MPRLLAVLVLLVPVLAATLEEVRVEGADPVLKTLVEISLPVQVGDPLDQVDLEAVQRAVEETGYFEEVEVGLRGRVLEVRVKPRPPIAEVKVVSRAIPPEALEVELANRLAIAAGSIYNPKKVEEARSLIARIYRQQGFPFEPRVEVETEFGDEGVKLVFKVKEDAAVGSLEVVGATLVPEKEIREAFRGLLELGHFDWRLYLAAVQKVAELYAARGYRGSGVDPARTSLHDGVLRVVIRELKVVAVDKDGLPESPIAVGEPLNYDRLLEAVAELTRELGREVRFYLDPEGSGVRVRFELGEARYGVITEVRVEGATAFPVEELKDLLLLKVGDPYNPQLAKADFERLLNYYREHGYALVPKPDFSFEDGVYTQRIREVRVSGYRLVWQGGHRTQDFVITREFPRPGELFSVPAIRRGVSRLLRLGILAAPPEVRTKPSEDGSRVEIELVLKEAKTVVVAPALAWSSNTGWSGQVTISDKNLWGRAHDVGLNLAFVENDAGDNLSFNFHYRVPWLYLDLADLKETPTSLEFSAYSVPLGNFPLLDDSEEDTGWEYTERRSGGSLSLGRPLNELVKVSLSLEGQWVTTLLETQNPPEDPAVDEETARGLLPKAYVNALAAATITYRDADDPAYPTTGQVASVHFGYGLVFPEGEATRSFVPLWASYKTYQALDESRRSVAAVRAAAGALLGEPPESRYFTLGGSEPELSMLRGYSNREFTGQRMFNASFELRYDFRLTTTVTRTVIGIAFVDVGSVWNPGEEPQPKVGYGLGVQLNLGYGAVQLPAIRLDYGFSPDHPGGILHFRIGPVF